MIWRVIAGVKEVEVTFHVFVKVWCGDLVSQAISIREQKGSLLWSVLPHHMIIMEVAHVVFRWL